jgi:hypothetical protein
MISFEELSAALDAYAQRMRGGEPPTTEQQLPAGGESPQAIYDDRSNELDVSDVLSDEEA